MVVADGALELEAEEWEQHMAELRLIVAHDFQRKGLGLLMARELFTQAANVALETPAKSSWPPNPAAPSLPTVSPSKVMPESLPGACAPR